MPLMAIQGISDAWSVWKVYRVNWNFSTGLGAIAEGRHATIEGFPSWQVRTLVCPSLDQ